jgi:hypothetical protein
MSSWSQDALSVIAETEDLYSLRFVKTAPPTAPQTWVLVVANYGRGQPGWRPGSRAARSARATRCTTPPSGASSVVREHRRLAAVRVKARPPTHRRTSGP